MKPSEPPSRKKWLQFSLLQLVVCALVAGAFLYFGIWIGGREHKQRADEQVRQIGAEKQGELMRQKHEVLEDEFLGFGAIERALQSAHDAINGEQTAETVNYAALMRLRVAFHQGQPRGMPGPTVARAWLDTFRRIPHAANKDRVEFLVGCLDKREKWQNAAEAWDAFIADTQANLLPLYWHACDDPGLADLLISKLHNPEHREMSQASGFLAWFFTCLSNSQREAFVQALLQVKFNLKEKPALSRTASPVFLTLTRPAEARLAWRQFCLGAECELKVFVDGQLTATLPGAELGLGARQSLDKKIEVLPKKVFESCALGAHKIRLVFSGAIIGAEFLGESPVPDWHSVPFERDSGEFPLTLK